MPPYKREIVGHVSATLRHDMLLQLGAPFRALSLKTLKPLPFYELELSSVSGDWNKGQLILKGHFQFGREALDLGMQGDPWSVAAPSERFAQWLHSFAWLSDLTSIKDEASVQKSRQLVDKWIKLYGYWNNFAWQSETLCDRVYNWMLIFSSCLSSDHHSAVSVMRRKSLVRQVKYLKNIAQHMPKGLQRLKAYIVLSIAWAAIRQSTNSNLNKSLDALDREIERQVLADGGHINRKPATCVTILQMLMVLDQALESRGIMATRSLERAIERMKHILPFFTAHDGGLVSFNGSGEGNRETIKSLNIRPTRPFQYCPHTGYQRIHVGDTVLIMDTGSSPPFPYDKEAHLAPLAFELSTKAGRLIVNCGWTDEQPEEWRHFVRNTAAHSTLILDNKNCGSIHEPGIIRKLLGAHLRRGIYEVKSTRREEDEGIWLQTHHNGYIDKTGLIHRRRLYVNMDGQDIRGEDSLLLPVGSSPQTRKQLPYDIRFHLHPDVRATLSQDQQSALLIQPGQTGWRFRTDVGPIKIEPSVYLGRGHTPIKSQQIIISSRAYGDSDGETRPNRVRWLLKRLETKS